MQQKNYMIVCKIAGGNGLDNVVFNHYNGVSNGVLTSTGQFSVR
jgi:hypothetical protein